MVRPRLIALICSVLTLASLVFLEATDSVLEASVYYLGGIGP
jgi:hypothetical protein